MKLTKKISIQRMVMVRRAMLWTSLVGLFASVYLLITYITGGPIACGIVSGCEAVRASKWAYTFGVPRPLLGVVFYLAVIFLLVVRVYSPKHRPRFWTTLTILMAGVGFIESAFLTMVQWYDIKAFCIWCLTSAFMATVLFILSFFEGDQDLERHGANKELKFIFISFATAIVVGGIIMWGLLARSGDGTIPASLIKPDISGAQLEDVILPPGTPTEGPATATVKIVEFVDLPCPVCHVFQPIMQQLRKDYAGKIEFAYRPFMLPEVHKFAEESAIAAQCARKQGKFIEYSDAALANQDHLERADLVHYADALHLDTNAFTVCLDDPAMAQIVVSERKAGEALGVDETPSIFFNQTLVKGAGSYDQIKGVIDDELKAASASSTK